MGYQRGEGRMGGEYRSGSEDERGRWRGQGGGRYGERGYGRERDRVYSEEDRGFFERAGDEVRSWFGDDDAERRREEDRLRYEREQGWSGAGSEDYGRGGSRHYAAGDIGQGVYGGSRSGVGSAETWGGSGFGGDYERGRRFDRVDVGSTGTHAAHPMSTPGGATYGGYSGYGITPYGGYSGSTSRYAGMPGGVRGGYRGEDARDRQYSEWRSRQIEQLDRDYDEYRHEHQEQFDREFGGWCEKRHGQRQAMSRITEHMEVTGSDGQHVGTVDDVRRDRIILTKSDESAGGRHHSIPCGWIEQVDDKVTINKTAEEAMSAWRDEEGSRALFEREEERSEGPHMLNRSFSGTYR